VRESEGGEDEDEDEDEREVEGEDEGVRPAGIENKPVNHRNR
jgi:hypothetical protein